MAINFKSVEELVAILESRGMKVDENTAPAIERESYYAIVNGYKSSFLDRQAMQASSDDLYLEGVEFQWVYDLFMFDRDLRFVTFKYLTRAEAVMRTAVAYAFCHHHPEQSAYLNRTNFCAWADYLVPEHFNGDKREQHDNNLNRLLGTLHGKVSIRENTPEYIRHYIRKYSTVPLWVLSNDLTFGNIVNFYQLMKEDDRREVCAIIARVSKRDKESRGHLTERKLLRASKLLNAFRNICAHDERLYCTKVGNDDFSEMTVRLADLLPAEDVNEFIYETILLFKDYEGRLHGVTPQSLLRDMGFNISDDVGAI